MSDDKQNPDAPQAGEVFSGGITRTLRLSPRELEIAQYLPYGLPDKLIAHYMGVATANSYLTKLMQKIKAPNRTAAAMWWVENEEEYAPLIPEHAKINPALLSQAYELPAKPLDKPFLPQEQEILDLLETGATNQEIIQRLGMSAGKVQYYLKTLMRKIGARNRTLAATWSKRQKMAAAAAETLPAAVAVAPTVPSAPPAPSPAAVAVAPTVPSTPPAPSPAISPASPVPQKTPQTGEVFSGGMTRTLRLSPRELEIVQYLPYGLPDKLIAHYIGNVTSTTKVHLKRLLRTINAPNRTAAAMWWIENEEKYAPLIPEHAKINPALLSQEYELPAKPLDRPFSPQEQEILNLLETAGATDKEIAQQLGLSESTVKTHLMTLLRKIGARNRTLAAAWSKRQKMAAAAAPSAPAARPVPQETPAAVDTAIPEQFPYAFVVAITRDEEMAQKFADFLQVSLDHLRALAVRQIESIPQTDDLLFPELVLSDPVLEIKRAALQLIRERPRLQEQMLLAITNKQNLLQIVEKLGVSGAPALYIAIDLLEKYNDIAEEALKASQELTGYPSRTALSPDMKMEWQEAAYEALVRKKQIELNVRNIYLANNASSPVAEDHGKYFRQLSQDEQENHVYTIASGGLDVDEIALHIGENTQQARNRLQAAVVAAIREKRADDPVLPKLIQILAKSRGHGPGGTE